MPTMEELRDKQQALKRLHDAFRFCMQQHAMQFTNAHNSPVVRLEHLYAGRRLYLAAERTHEVNEDLGKVEEYFSKYYVN